MATLPQGKVFSPHLENSACEPNFPKLWLPYLQDEVRDKSPWDSEGSSSHDAYDGFPTALPNLCQE